MGSALHVAADAAAAHAAAALLGGAAFSPADIPPGETPMQAWARCLRQQAPAAVVVHDPGPLPPDALWQLREREIPYALALTDFLQICPIRRLWRRRGEICSGPSRNGLKCALCAAPGKLDWPLVLPQFRQRPAQWQAAMAGAEVLLAPTRFLRDAWLDHGAPADRLIVLPPLGSTYLPPPPPNPPLRAPRSILYAGGWDEANGVGLLAEAVRQLESPVRVLATGALDAAAQDRLRAAFPPPHQVEFPGALDRDALHLRLRAAAAAVLPSRWQEAYGPLLDAAQWSGAVPVATAIGAMPERLIHGLNGLLADPEDPLSLAEALESAFASSWDAVAACRHREAEAAATLAAWRALAAALPAREPTLALRLGYAPLLAAAQQAFGLDPAQAEQNLRTAFEMPEMDSIEPAEQAFLQTVPLLGRIRRVHLNHALACLHQGGLRRVLVLSAGLGDAAAWFEEWGLVARAVPGDGMGGEPPSAPLARLGAHLCLSSPEPDFAPQALFLEAPADVAALRRRFPTASAVLTDTPAGLEISE